MSQNQSLPNDQYEEPSNNTITHNLKSGIEIITSMLYALHKSAILYLAHKSLNIQGPERILQTKPNNRPVLPG